MKAINSLQGSFKRCQNLENQTQIESPDKTVLVHFTNNKKMQNYAQPKVFGKTATLVKEVKYGCVLLDSKLN